MQTQIYNANNEANNPSGFAGKTQHFEFSVLTQGKPTLAGVCINARQIKLPGNATTSTLRDTFATFSTNLSSKSHGICYVVILATSSGQEFFVTDTAKDCSPRPRSEKDISFESAHFLLSLSRTSPVTEQSSTIGTILVVASSDQAPAEKAARFTQYVTKSLEKCLNPTLNPAELAGTLFNHEKKKSSAHTRPKASSSKKLITQTHATAAPTKIEGKTSHFSYLVAAPTPTFVECHNTDSTLNPAQLERRFNKIDAAIQEHILSLGGNICYHMLLIKQEGENIIFLPKRHTTSEIEKNKNGDGSIIIQKIGFTIQLKFRLRLEANNNVSLLTCVNSKDLLAAKKLFDFIKTQDFIGQLSNSGRSRAYAVWEENPETNEPNAPRLRTYPQ